MHENEDLDLILVGKEKPPFDRAKQGHVITVDNYCQICTTTV